jgi:hypothetical protein
MNKRIIELADQAGFVRFSPDEDPTMPIDWSCDYDVELQKFAYLIVQECAAVCDLYGMPDGTSQTAMILSSAIKRKFGITDE